MHKMIFSSLNGRGIGAAASHGTAAGGLCAAGEELGERAAPVKAPRRRGQGELFA